MTTIDHETSEILDAEPEATTTLATAPDMTGADLATAPLNWNALVRISDTDFVPRALRNNPSAVMAAVFSGREVGLSPMASLRLVDIIDGSPSFSAELTVALIRAAGHRIVLVEETDSACTIEGIRAGNDQDRMTLTYSLHDAERAGLLSIDDNGRPRARSRNNKALPWETYTPDLLWARAVSRLSRRLFPDVLAAPSRTAVATFEASEPSRGGDEAALSVSNAVYELGHLLEAGTDGLSTAKDAEVFLRKACRLAVASQIAAEDPLPGILSSFAVRHVTDLKAAEIRQAATDAHRYISEMYSDAVGSDISTASLERQDEQRPD